MENKELRYYLSGLGYTPQEITEGIAYYNESHQINTIDKIRLPLAVGLIMRIIDELNYSRKEFKK